MSGRCMFGSGQFARLVVEGLTCSTIAGRASLVMFSLFLGNLMLEEILNADLFIEDVLSAGCDCIPHYVSHT